MLGFSPIFPSSSPTPTPLSWPKPQKTTVYNRFHCESGYAARQIDTALQSCAQWGHTPRLVYLLSSKSFLILSASFPVTVLQKITNTRMCTRTSPHDSGTERSQEGLVLRVIIIHKLLVFHCEMISDWARCGGGH